MYCKESDALKKIKPSSARPKSVKPNLSTVALVSVEIRARITYLRTRIRFPAIVGIFSCAIKTPICIRFYTNQRQDI